MRPEIYDIIERCKECGTATVFAVLFHEEDEQGAMRAGIRSDRVPHARDKCAEQVKLNREEWPVLF